MDFPRRFVALFSVLGAGLTAGLASCSALNAPDDVIPMSGDTTTSGGGDGGSAGAGAGAGGSGGSGGGGGGGLCNGPEDCASGFCVNGECVAVTCTDNIRNGGETDVDCGGADCAPCAIGEDCLVEADCAGGTCSDGVCAAASCTDNTRNGDETDVDCGGAACPACAAGQSCIGDADCAQVPCVDGVCELSVTFTSCGKTGDLGPSQADCDLAYPPRDPLAGQVTVAAGIQEWIVPATGTYEIEALGAQGGNHDFGPGGLGASMRGEFELTQGQLLRVLVGQKGGDGTAYDVGGGGGTFVTLSDNTPLVVAGGGGGAGNCGDGFNPALQAGSSLLGNGNGGTSGNDGNFCGCGGEGSGGGGFFGDGGGNGGLSFLNGGNGCSSERPEQCVDSGLGGFGGGGNGGNGGGGGGGYQGGDAGGLLGAAGKGGLSFNNGLNPINSTGVQSGHGLVIIRSI